MIGATTFWFLNALNKNYTTTFAYPVEFNFDREQYTSVDKLPDEVEIQVSGQGWDLMWESITLYRKGLKFDLQNTPGKVIIKKWQLEKTFNDDLHTIQLEQAMSDELFLEINTYASKESTVMVDTTTIRFSKGYNRSGSVNVSPSNLVFKGPEATIQKIPDTILIKLSDEKLSDDYDEEIDLEEYVDFYNVTSNIPSGVIQVSFDVSEMKAKTFEVPVVVSNYNRTDSTFRIPKKLIKVECKVPEGLTISKGDFSFAVDLDSQRFTQDTMLPVKLTKTPAYIYDLQIQDSLLPIDVISDTTFSINFTTGP